MSQWVAPRTPRHAGKIVINAMTRRSDRSPPALAPGYARVDERSLADLLDFAVKVAPLFGYFGPDDTRDGTFGDFFLNDPAMVLGAIVALDLDELEGAAALLERQVLEARGQARKLELLGEVFQSTAGLARRLDDWLRHLGPRSPASAADVVRDALESAIGDTLGTALLELKSYADGAGLAAALHQAIPLDITTFSPLWGAGSVAPDGAIYRGRTLSHKIDHALPALGAISDTFVQAIAALQTLARQALDAALHEGNHAPHLALYIAFAQLFQTAQDTINDLTQRYVDFYYREVLREAPAGPVGDSVYLTFTLAPSKGVVAATVPRGTRFSAGKDQDGVDIVFAAGSSLEVGAGVIDRLRTLRVTSAPLVPSAAGGAAGTPVIQRVLATEITPGAAPFAIFGQGSEGQTGSELTSAATLGFAIASPHLLLTGGQRTLEVWIRCSAASMLALRALLTQLGGATGASEAAILRDVLARAFTLHVSTPAGWLEIDAYEVVAGDDVFDTPEIALSITLPPGAPSLAPIDPAGPNVGANTGSDPAGVTGATLEPTPSPALPALKVMLDQDPIALEGGVLGGTEVTVYALSLLAGLQVDALWVCTAVSGLTDLTLANPGGPLSLQKPFPIFGAAPGVGSYLDIYHPEIFVAKRPDSVDVRIDWFNLPPDDTGFKGYYAGYAIGIDGAKKPVLFDDQSFRVSLQVMQPVAFELGDDAQNLYLFQTDPSVTPPATAPAGKPAPATELDDLLTVPRERPAYSDASKSTIRMSLVAPPEAFGDLVYARNVVAAVAGSVPDPAGCQSGCELLYQPLVEAAELIQKGIDLCGAKGGADCQNCFAAWLPMCAGMLSTAISNALTSGAAQAELAPEVAQRLDADAAAFKAATLDTRKKAIGSWLADYCAVLGADAGTCGGACTALWNALNCLDDCSAKTAPAQYPGQMVACLTACRTTLEKSYADGVKACVDACARAPKTVKVPNAPWLPRATQVSLGYTTRCRIVGTAPAVLDAEQAGELFHLLPFGGFRLLDPATGTVTLLPAFDGCAGSLMLGFTGLAPPVSPTLLVQLAAAGDDGSAKGPAVTWERLSGNAWVPLPPAEARTDGTRGLRRTGLLRLTLPAYDPTGNTVLSGDHQWIRARVAEGADGFPSAVAVTPYALLATWQNNGNAGAHLALPRPPGSIKSSIDKLANIKTIAQPMASFGGRPPETAETMPIRLGERLRHKDRGIVGWDYERLVLEQFPQIDRVRTLPARGPGGAAPGEVTVVVLPGPDGQDDLEPTVSADVLEEIAIALTQLTSPFVTVHVVNPVYVQITVNAVVEFTPDEDPDVCKRLLGAELVQELSPWSVRPPWVIAGEDYPTEDDIAELIRTRPYVVALTSLVCDYTPADLTKLDWYFLTSAPEHSITASAAAPATEDAPPHA